MAWFLTLADFQLPPVSLVVLGCIMAIESGLDVYIDRVLGDSLEEMLTPCRTAKITRPFDELRRRNVEISKRACLNLDDRLRIMSNSPALRRAAGISRNRADRDGEELKRLRDILAHGGSLLDFDRDPTRGIEVADKARQTAELIWRRN